MQHYPFIVIGAGLAGANAAHALRNEGHDVLIVDKARGTGGRASSKRVAVGDHHFTFDMGLTAFTGKSGQWLKQVNALEKQQKLDAWYTDAEEEYYCGRGRNSVVTRTLLGGCEQLLSTRVLAVKRHDDGQWQLDVETYGQEPQTLTTSNLIITTPSQQAADMLPNAFANTKAALSSLTCHPSFVTLLVCEKKLSSSQAIMPVNDSTLSSIVFEHSKPERNSDGYTLLKLQSDVTFTTAHLDGDKDEVGAKMINAAEGLLGPLRAVAQHTHRWLYSQYSDHVGEELMARDVRLSSGFLRLADNLLIASDYAYKAYTQQHPQALRVSDAESACLSGLAAAEALLDVNMETA